MLIHKASRGVLAAVAMPGPKEWIIRTGLRLDMYPDLDPAEWWEVRDNTRLAKKILRSYPDFSPVVLGGELVDIVIHNNDQGGNP